MNAVVHRDHRQMGVVRVEHAPTHVKVTSPGPFVSGVTPQNILKASRPRNAVLASAARALGLAEQAGVGVDRMYREMTRIGHEPPTFESDGNAVTVTLLGGAPNAHVARYVAGLPAEEADDADTLLVIYTLLHRRTVSAQDLSPVLQKSPAEVEGVLRRLASADVAVLEPTRQTARRALPDYRLRESAVSALGPALGYRRRTQDEVDRKIIGLLAETGEINARMVRMLLDLDSVAASRVLADLVEREILVKTSRAQRGRGVKYGPGPRFVRPSGRSRKR